MKKYVTSSPEETKKLAKKLAKKFINKSGVIALIGELGVGKTTFVQGFAEGLGIKEKIISPTFVLMRQHKTKNNQTLYHLDLYRIENRDGVKSIGLQDLFNNNIVIIEWAEKAEDLLPKNTVKIIFTNIDEKTREIIIEDQD